MIKLKSIAEIDRAIQDVDRPMRWTSAEGIAKRFLKSVLDYWQKLEKDLFELLKDISENSDAAQGVSPLYPSLLRNERQSKIYDLFKIENHGSHFHVVEKKGDVKREEIILLITRLSEYLTVDQIASIENLFNQYSPGLIDKPFSKKGPIMNKYFPEVIQDGYDEALKRVTRAAKAQGQSSALANLSPVFGFSYETPFVDGFLSDAFKLVTSKVTVAAQGQVLSEMLTGFENGDTWTTIARNIHKSVGTAYRYHWKRLVRTEMTSAYYQSMTHVFRETNIQYVQLSLSVGACPICIGLRGYYTLGLEPSLPSSTHPNCRCVYIPYFRLPEGVKVVN